MFLYAENEEIIDRARCVIHRAFGLQHARKNVDSERVANAFCCSVAQDAEQSPVLLSSRFDQRTSEAGGQKERTTICVTGRNLGASRGSSMLSVGTTPVETYVKWSDPGTPYTAGHSAEVCGVLDTPPKTDIVAIQLTTARGVSNTLLAQRAEASKLAAKLEVAGSSVR
jgi:hypothetical protein